MKKPNAALAHMAAKTIDGIDGVLHWIGLPLKLALPAPQKPGPRRSKATAP